MNLDLSALLEKPAPQNDGKPLRLLLADIEPDPNQPRSEKKPEEIAEIGENIKDRGVKLPISVKPHPTKSNKWIINDGELRYLGSQFAGLHDIPVVIDNDFDDFDQVNANEKRFALRPMDLALFIQRKLNEGLKKAEIARRLGKDAPSITMHLSLIDLPPCIKNIYETERCTSPKTLYELKTLHEKFTGDVERWCEENEEVTRKTVSNLADYLKNKPEIHEEPLQNEGVESHNLIVGNEQNLSHDQEKAVNTANEENFKPTENCAGENKEGNNSKDGDDADKGKNHDPAIIKKPLLFIEYNGRVARVLLNRTPSAPGLIHINYEGEKEEIEVDATQCKISLLIEGRK